MRFSFWMTAVLLIAPLAANAAGGATKSPDSSDHMNSQYLFMVVSKGLPGISLYKGNDEKPFCRAVVEKSPHEAAFSPDGQMAYLPVYGSSSVGLAGTDEHLLHFIRTSDCKDTGVLDTEENKRPHGIAVGKSGTIYLTSEVVQSVLLIDPKQRRIIGKIPTGSPYSHMIAVTKDEKKIFVSNVQSKTVSVLDISSRKLEKTISTGSEDQRMTLSPDGRWFVTNLGPEHKIAFYRTSDYQLDFAVEVNGGPFVAKFSHDGRYLYDAGNRSGEMLAWKVDVNSRKVVATVENLGKGIGSLVVNPFDGQVFVSAATPSQISIIDPKTWKVMKTMQANKTPDEMAFVGTK